MLRISTCELLQLTKIYLDKLLRLRDSNAELSFRFVSPLLSIESCTKFISTVFAYSGYSNNLCYLHPNQFINSLFHVSS